MKKIYVLIIPVFTLASFAGLAQSEKTEELINQMEAAGKLKRMGNRLEFIVDKGSDTMLIRKKYENVFKKPDGSNYEIQFLIDPKFNQNNKQLPATTLPQNNKPGNRAAGTPAVPVTGALNNNSQGCFENMLVFGESRYNEELKKYEWVVPQGISKIKIECWSGGGNGFFLAVDEDSLGNQSGSRSGSGGGGGAYALAVIDVKPGDIIKMNIPGGGGRKSVLIQMNDILNSLLIGNGSDGITGFGAGYDGKGGFVGNQNIRGVFEGKVYWVSGENGSFHSMVESEYFNNEYFGNGGGAAKLNNGGRGGKVSQVKTTWVFTSTNSTNGGFPGGGGGAGFSTNYNRIPIAEREEGKGAPGVVIIYY